MADDRNRKPTPAEEYQRLRDSISREEEWRLVRQATPHQQKAIIAQMTRSYEELQGDNAVNEKQQLRVSKAAQKAGIARQPAAPPPSTQDRAKDAINRDTQDRMQQTMKARAYAMRLRDPLHQRTVARRSPTNALPPLDKPRETVQDSPKKGVSMDKD